VESLLDSIKTSGIVLQALYFLVTSLTLALKKEKADGVGTMIPFIRSQFPLKNHCWDFLKALPNEKL